MTKKQLVANSLCLAVLVSSILFLTPSVHARAVDQRAEKALEVDIQQDGVLDEEGPKQTEIEKTTDSLESNQTDAGEDALKNAEVKAGVELRPVEGQVIKTPSKAEETSEKTEGGPSSAASDRERRQAAERDEKKEIPAVKALRTNSPKDYVLTSDETGEVVAAWDQGEEANLLGVLQNMNSHSSADPNMILVQGPHTLTLNANLVIPKTLLLQQNQHLTIQSASGRQFTLSMGKVTHSTPVNEEIIDAAPGEVCLTLKDLILDGRSESRGIHIKKGDVLTASNCIFKNFVKPSDIVRGGMGIIAEDCKSLSLKSCLFENNDAGDSSAAAVGVNNVVACEFTKVTFRNNRGRSAAAVMLQGAQVNAVMRDCTFIGNEANGSGYTAGALSLAGKANAQIYSSVFEHNKACHGGAIRINSDSRLTLEQCTLSENEATQASGGAILSQGALDIKDSTFVQNRSGKNGGAIYHSQGEMSIANTKFEGNQTSETGGAIMLLAGGRAEIKDKTTFESNSTGALGGAIFDASFSYKDPADATTAYKNLVTDETVNFIGNSAPYLYNPPSNYRDFHWIKFARTTFTGAVNPNTKGPVLRDDFPLNNYDINYLNDPVDDFFDVSFEYKSRDSEIDLPASIAATCPEKMMSPLNSLIIPPAPDQVEITVDGQSWRFDRWEPGSAEITSEGMHFIGYWLPLRNITVSKVWNDQDNREGKRPDAVTVKLLADGVDTGKTLVLSEENGWTASFEGLIRSQAGKKIAYTVAEVGLEDVYQAVVSGNDADGFIITNNYKWERPEQPTRPSEPMQPSHPQESTKCTGTPTCTSGTESTPNQILARTGEGSQSALCTGLILLASASFLYIWKRKFKGRA